MSSTRNADAIAEVFYRYDTNHTGKLEREKLRSAILDLNGRQIDDDELNHIYELLEGKDGYITLDNFVKVNEQFFKYC
ncbi:EF-hand family [Trichomonas vaginalis G3]|uniref:EF-hand family n=1 Tax=Trichomonas vaginalis (strain ATCC PRA-98 / G3) TaxID=412133 RepID=UPI0021E54B9E|nr:EF-hand family [Trichomonas vaginalis G3]KAI5516533.1 EF-hand family [Trichomonas vaginalis G3]